MARRTDMLQRVQKRTTKIIQKLRDISYEMSLSECGLPTQKTRRLREEQTEMLKQYLMVKNILIEILFYRLRNI